MLPTISSFDARQATRFPMELLPRERELEWPDEGVRRKTIALNRIGLRS
jgi:hypothetical protein